jgi:ATP-binding cassette subfamily F protein 3
VFADVSFIVERGDRIALVGVNGAGKSTLIKLLADLEPLSGGEYHVGHNVEIDYFAQDQYKELNPEACMIDDLGRVAPQKTQSELRTLLGSFLFPADEVFKRIGVLSGGERNRYALARMLLQPSNFLLLDEPTNHLDLRAKDVLLEALEKFTGTVVFVSHDRYFIDNLATRVFEVADGGVHVFPGNYEDYLWRKQQQAQAAAAANDGPAKSASADTSGETKQAEPPEPRKRVNPIKLRQMAERCQELEEAIARVEAKIADAEQSLTVFVSAEETQRVVELLAGKRGELETLVAEWSEVSHFIESNA